MPKKQAKPKVNPLLSEVFSTASPERVGCDTCRRFETCRSPYSSPYVPRGWTGKYLFITEHAADSKAGRLLRTLYREAGINDLDVCLADTVRCHPRKHKPPSMSQLRACRPFLLRTIERLKPSYVIGFGARALHTLANDGTGGITDARGRYLEVPGLQCRNDQPATGDAVSGGSGNTRPLPKVWVTYDPSAILGGAGEFRGPIAADLAFQSRPELQWPREGVPEGVAVSFDSEYAKDEAPLTTGLASDTAAVAYETTEESWKQNSCSVLAQAKVLVGHSMAGDLDQMIQMGMEPPSLGTWITGEKCLDSLLISRMVNENMQSYSLEDVLTSRFRVEPWKYKSQSTLEASGDMSTVSSDIRRERCRLDAWASYVLAKKGYRQFSANLVEFTHRVAMAIHRIRLAGAMVDMTEFEKMGGHVNQEASKYSELLARIATAQGIEEFKPSNDGHIRSLLYDHLGYRTDNTTDGGDLSTDKVTLKGLKDSPAPESDPGYGTVDILLNYSKWEKLLGTNVVGLSKLIRPLGSLEGSPLGLLAFRINPLGARTGRRSSTKPNSQNWPTWVRRIIRSRWAGGQIGDFDYNRLEIFIIAWLAQEWKLFDYFSTGNGYINVAKELFGFEVKDGTKEYKATKSTILGVGYNMQDDKLAHQLWFVIGVRLSTDWDEHCRLASKLRRKYLGLFPRLGQYMDERGHELLTTQQVVAPCGAIRHLPCPDGERTPGFGHLLNQAINYPVQRTASDCTGSALIDIEADLAAEEGMSVLEWHKALLWTQKELLTKGRENVTIPYTTCLINEVHDSIVPDFHPDRVERHAEIVVTRMKEVRWLRKLCPKFDIPLGVGQKIGPTWGLD